MQMTAKQEVLWEQEGIAFRDSEGDLWRFIMALDAFFLALYELQEMGCRVRFTRD